ncbi:flagellar filament capping protein FliD [Neobacillus sp. K501]
MVGVNNTLRISGLASGMNTDEIVAQLVNAQSSRLNKMMQNKISTSWKSDAYRDVNKKVDEFRKAMEGLRLESTFNKQAVTSSSTSVTASSAGTSTQTNFQITSATPAQAAKPAMVSFNSGMASGTTSIGTSAISFSLNGTSVTLDANMTFDQAIARINESSSSTNVKASNVGGSLVFTSLGTGATQKVEITGATSNSLKIADTIDPNTSMPGPVKGVDAKDGSVTINGTTIIISTNTFTYDGVTFNINGAIDSTKPVSIQVGSDTDSVFNSIKTFVDKYNELIADLNGKMTEKRYRDFPPLLDEQKKDMKENEIKLWEEKAKSGLLTRDSTISNLLTEMRNSLISTVEGTGGSLQSLKEIGINFSANYKDNGKLVVDEAKLKGILQTNLEDVKKLFTANAASTASKETTVTDSNIHKNSGFAYRIYDRLNETISQLGVIAGSPTASIDTKSNIAKQLLSLDENIDNERDKVSAYEKRLWKQFTAMEKALSQLNSQGSWISQQLGM